MDPVLMTAWATVVIAGATVMTVVIGSATCLLVWRGIGEMRRSSDERARDRQEAARRLEEWRDADIRRHKEVMQAEASRHKEAMAALAELIERTRPPAGPAN